MNKILFPVLVFIFIFAYECPATEQSGQQSDNVATQGGPSVGAKIADVALVRPVCMVGSTISTAVYLVISPFAYVMGLGEPAARTMVEGPWRFTGSRYIGEFNHYKDERPITGVWDFF
jgi:hypothetical protein